MTDFDTLEDLDETNFFDKEHLEDAKTWTDDLTKRFQKKAKENPNGWHAKVLRTYGGHLPFIKIKRPVRISHFDRTIDVRKIEEDNERILERW